MNKKINVLIFSKYDRLGASSRLRTIQYIQGIEKKEISITLSPLFDNKYLEELYSIGYVTKKNIILYYFKRFKILLSIRKYDLIWIEKEIFPWLPLPVEKIMTFLSIKYIVDYDDAIFHNYDAHRSKLVRLLLSKKIPTVMKYANLVSVCNEYLKLKAQNAGAKNIQIIPTVIDTTRYIPMYKTNNKKLVIGWIGTPKTEKYLIDLMDVFKECAKTIDIKIINIGGNFFHCPYCEYEILTWSEEKEMQYLQEIDIGIMPLVDSLWEEGKCGYKLIQYMGSGKPVIASAVGMNCDIVKNGKNGYLVKSNNDWVDAILKLNDICIREKMGKEARSLVEAKYSLNATLHQRIDCIKKVVNK